MRQDAHRRDTRVTEALQSPKWETKLVAERNLAWLKKTGEAAESVGLKDVVGTILHRMVLDGQYASAIVRMLDAWKAWADIGGMKRGDFASLQTDQVLFSEATLLVALIKDTTTALEGTLSVDLQECLRMWRKVRLG